MKILHLAKHLNPGGITTYLSELLPPLQKRGHEVYLATGGGERETVFAAQGIHCLRGPFATRSEFNPKLYGGLPEYLRLVRETRMDVIHAHTRVTQIFAFFLSRFSGCPFVSTVHGFYKNHWGRKLLPALGERAIAISPAVAEPLKKECRISPERVRVIPNAIDVEGFSEKIKRVNRSQVFKKYGLNPSKPLIGFVGRLEKVKGGTVLLAAARELAQKKVPFQVLFAGEGKERGEWESLVRQWSLEKHVVFTGAVEPIHEIYAALDVFVYPILWEEGFGLSVLEAMAAGKPVIASGTGAMPFLVEDWVTGFVVSKNEPRQLAAKILELAGNEKMRLEMGERGFQKAKQRFSIASAVDSLEQIYGELSGKVRK
jgi:glycosyltransferase involved in cell wall biosynthesis